MPVYEGGNYREYQFPLVVEPMGEWTEQALCAEKVRAGEAHPNDWFPVRGTPIAEIHAAVAICQQCPVVEPCRDWAIKHNEYGIWGGWTSKKLRQVRYSEARQCKQCFQYFPYLGQEVHGTRPSFCSEKCRQERKWAVNQRSRDNRRVATDG